MARRLETSVEGSLMSVSTRPEEHARACECGRGPGRSQGRVATRGRLTEMPLPPQAATAGALDGRGGGTRRGLGARSGRPSGEPHLVGQVSPLASTASQCATVPPQRSA